MSNFTLQFVLGRSSYEQPGQWVEGSVEFGHSSFEVSADICRRIGSDEFSIYRVHEQLGGPFTAELFLGVLSLIADGEFQPSGSGLELSYSGEGIAPTEEIARILEPDVRGNASAAAVPPDVTETLRKQLQYIRRMRRLQRGMMHLNG